MNTIKLWGTKSIFKTSYAKNILAERANKTTVLFIVATKTK